MSTTNFTDVFESPRRAYVAPATRLVSVQLEQGLCVTESVPAGKPDTDTSKFTVEKYDDLTSNLNPGENSNFEITYGGDPLSNY